MSDPTAAPPKPVTITINDREITVTLVKVKNLPEFIRAVEPIAQNLASGDFMAALSLHAENFIEATALGADVERQWLDTQEIDSLFELAGAVLAVNADFFVQRLTPALVAAAEKFALMIPGMTSSLPSSVPATATGT